jgi:hypothetical protein
VLAQHQHFALRRQVVVLGDQRLGVVHRLAQGDQQASNFVQCDLAPLADASGKGGFIAFDPGVRVVRGTG